MNRNFIAACALALFGTACGVKSPEKEEVREWSIALHGGAGYFGEEDYTPEEQAAYRASLQRALDWGKAALASGAPALDVVEGVVARLEDDSLFNAGRGAGFR